MRAQDILKNSLLQLYADLPEVIDLIHQCDFSRVSRKFVEELYQHISPDEFDRVDKMIRSEEVRRYDKAIQSAALACTRDLSDLLDFTLQQNEGGKIN